MKPHPNIALFLQEVTQRYPQIDDYSEEKLEGMSLVRSMGRDFRFGDLLSDVASRAETGFSLYPDGTT